MGLDTGEITLDSPNGAYYSGQHVNGKVMFKLSQPKKVRGIHLTLKGFCKIHWTSSHSRRVNDRTENYTVSHDSYEEYVSIRIFLFGNKNDEHQLDRGEYEYPFNFQIPNTCPSSFEGTHGHVRYELRAVMDIPYATDQEKFREIKVHAPLDLNTINCKEPVNFQFDQSFCCWCVSAGSAETIVKLPVTGYCPGQTIPIEVGCQNRSTVEINTIKFNITKEVKYRAENAPDVKSEHKSILESHKGPVAAHTDRNWLVELAVPALDIYNMRTCSFIDISYILEVTIATSGCHTDEKDSCSLVFGTIPLTGFQDNVPNPLQCQLPQINAPLNTYPPTISPYPPAILNQPVSSNQQYCNTYSPYPPNPYPKTPSPYPESGGLSSNPSIISPNMNIPYQNPQNASPYPTSPYPNAPYTSPQPNNAPYPSEQTNSPYPTPQPNTSPYPNSQSNTLSQPNISPYPTHQPFSPGYPPQQQTTPLSSPQPNNPSYHPSPIRPHPFPQSNITPYPLQPNTSPYPSPQPHNASFPGTTHSTLTQSGLKTGNLGFVVGNTGSSMPELPVGSVPRILNQSPRPTSPFIASAPPLEENITGN